MRNSAHGRADLHVHTIWSDGAQRPEAIVDAGRGRLDAIAITDHDEIRGALRARDYALAHPELGVDVVVGEEISTLNGHLLASSSRSACRPVLPRSRASLRCTPRGGLAIAAHPFHPIRGVARGHASIGSMIRDLPLDGIELVNNAGVFSALYNAWAALYNAELMLPVTAGSDAHDVWYVGGPSRDSTAATPPRCAGRSWPAARAPRRLDMDRRQDAPAPRGADPGRLSISPPVSATPQRGNSAVILLTWCALQAVAGLGPRRPRRAYEHGGQT